jgi:hypothetical protein
MQAILQIRQTSALIGMNSSPGNLSIRQPQADLQITTTSGEWEMHKSPLEVNIDQSRARAAYTGGTLAEINQRIYSGIEQIWLQGIANRMEQGDRVAHFQRPGNSIAEVYGGDWQAIPFPEIRAAAAFDNVDIHIEAIPLQMMYHKGTVDIQVEVHKPEIQYNRGNLEIYLRQKNSISFIPPKIDIGM